MLVLSNPVVGREAEFERWYSEVHVPQMLEQPGFVSCQRFVLSDAQMGGSHPQRYLALWEIEGTSLSDVFERLRGDMKSGALAGCEAFDQSTALSHVFTPIAERSSRHRPDGGVALKERS